MQRRCVCVCVCVCACACVHACLRACICVCVHACGKAHVGSSDPLTILLVLIQILYSWCLVS